MYDVLYNLHQIAGVIGTGLFLGLGQLLAITGPLGVLLVFLLVGSVAFASVLSSVPNSRSDLEVTYFVAP
jgi:L-asparagine transporter-like permease